MTLKKITCYILSVQYKNKPQRISPSIFFDDGVQLFLNEELHH